MKKRDTEVFPRGMHTRPIVSFHFNLPRSPCRAFPRRMAAVLVWPLAIVPAASEWTKNGGNPTTLCLFPVAGIKSAAGIAAGKWFPVDQGLPSEGKNRAGMV